MNVRNLYLLSGLISLLSIFSCKSSVEVQINHPDQGEFFDFISEYGLFSVSNRKLIPNPLLTKYEVTNPLFTDYALKDRFIYHPQNTQLTLKEDGTFDFPAGSLLVKNFFYDKEQTEIEKVIETRILLKDQNEWRAISYVWDEAMKDAKISKVGDEFPMSIRHEERGMLNFNYIVPNKNQCKSCHNYDEKIDPLGFKFANINKEVSTNEGQVNQVAFLISQGVIKEPDFDQSDLSFMQDLNRTDLTLQERALAYLDVNCGHCHRPEGPGNTSGLFLQYDETRTNHLGFCKGPVAAGKGSGGRKFDIYPGLADSSILVHRMASLDPGVMMPEVGRALVHTEGVELVKAWINDLNFDCYED